MMHLCAHAHMRAQLRTQRAHTTLDTSDAHGQELWKQELLTHALATTL